MNLNNTNTFETEEDIPFHIGGIIERSLAAPQPLGSSASSSSPSSSASFASASTTLKPMKKVSAPGNSFPKPMPNKMYTTRQQNVDSGNGSSLAGFAQKTAPGSSPPPSSSSSASSPTLAMSGRSGPPSAPPTKNEQPIETSEFLQILRETMMMSSNNNNNNNNSSKNNSTSQKDQPDHQQLPTPIKFDAGSQENLPIADLEKISSTSMDTILRVARSAVPAQRAAALRSLQLRCSEKQLSGSNSRRDKKRHFQQHDFFINAPVDVATSLFHPEESGPRLAMLAHLAYEDANQTVREAALLMWLTLLSSEERDDDILDTLVLAAITGAPTDEGDERSGSNGTTNRDDDDDDEEEDSEEQRRIDEEELRKRRLLAGGDTVPREMDDVDLRCGPTGVRIERKYFTLEAVSKLLREDPALGLARLGVYRTLLDRAVGRAADHDPAGSALDPVVGGSTLLDNRSLWRAVAIASHESPTAAAYICEHRSFFTAFQLLIRATIGAHRGDEIPTAKVGSELLPCVRDALIAILSAVHSNSTRAHRTLPKLWSEGGIFLFLKFLEVVVSPTTVPTTVPMTTTAATVKVNKETAAKHVDDDPHNGATHCHSAKDHFRNDQSNNDNVFANQCCALLCCIIRAAVRFGVPLSSESMPFEELDEREKLKDHRTEPKGNKQDERQRTVRIQDSANETDKAPRSNNHNFIDPEISTWFGEVYSFLVFTARHVGSFAVLEMLLLSEISASAAREAESKRKKEEKDKKLKPIVVRQHETKADDSSSSSSDQEDEEQEDEEEIRFVKTDLKKTIDEIVFPCVENALNKLLEGDYDDEGEGEGEGAESGVSLAASTGAHLVATWIGEGSLLAVFFGDRDDGQVLFKKIEPLLQKSLQVLQFHIFAQSSSSLSSSSSDNNNNNNNNNARDSCIVVDAFAHGLARIVDAVAKCYPKVRSRVAFHLQEIFATLITAPTESSVFRVNLDGNDDDVDVILKETKQMVADVLGSTTGDNNNNNNNNNSRNNPSSSSVSKSFSSKEESLSRVTRLSSVGELLRTAQWMMMTTVVTTPKINTNNNKYNSAESSSSSPPPSLAAATDDPTTSSFSQLPSVLIRNEVVTCVALNLVRVAMRCRGAADTAVSAGLSLILPVRDNESAAVERLREHLARSLVEITSSPQPKVAPSLPVSLRLDPLSAWMLNPCLFGTEQQESPKTLDDGDDGDDIEDEVDETSISQPAREGKNQRRRQELDAKQRKEQQRQNEAVEVRVAWAQWLGDLIMKVSTIASSLNSASASLQIHSLLPHPLSVLSAAFLASFCNEDPREDPPRFFSSSSSSSCSQNRRTLENLAATSFILCCASAKTETPRCKEHHRQLRKEALETICRCAGQNSDVLEMLFLLTVAALLRGSADTWSPLLTLWLERAHWLFSAKDLVSKSKMIQSCCNKKNIIAVAAASTSVAAASAGVVAASSSSSSPSLVLNQKQQRLIFTRDERDALQFATAIVESLASAAQVLPPDESAGTAALPIFVKAALLAVAQLTAPCGDFVRTNILQLIEDRLWIGADDTVRGLQNAVSAGGKQVYEFWTGDLA